MAGEEGLPQWGGRHRPVSLDGWGFLRCTAHQVELLACSNRPCRRLWVGRRCRTFRLGGHPRGRCQGGGGVTGRFRIEVSFNRLHLLLRSKPLEAGNPAGGVGFGWNGFKGGGDGTFQTLKHAPGMAQSDLPFRGMNVDVHLVGWAIKVHHRQRVPSLHQSGLVTSPDGLKERTCCYRTSIDENMDVVAFPSRDVGCADPTAPSLASWRVVVFGRRLQGHQLGGLCTHDVVQPVQHVVG